MWEWAKLHPFLFTLIWIIFMVGISEAISDFLKFVIKMNKIKWYQKNFPGVKPEQWDGYEPSVIKGGKNPPPSTPRPDFTPPAHKKGETRP